MESGKRNKTDLPDQIVRSRRQVQVFLVCLAIATFIWLLIKLSKEYNYESVIRVEYKNFPPGKALCKVVDSTLILSVRASGYYTLYRKFFKSNELVSVDLSALKMKKNGSFYEGSLQTTELNNLIQAQLTKYERLVSVYPTVLHFRFENAKSKKIPVVSALKLTFEKQFGLYGDVILEPDSITVSGPIGQIDSIQYITTEQLRFDMLKEDKKIRVGLKINPGTGNLVFDPDSVTATISVAEFTETKIEVDVTIDSLPEGMQIKTYPEKVTVVFHVALKDYKSLDADMFQLTVNGNEAINKSDHKLKVSVKKVPEHIKVISLEPEKVEYIISK